MLYIMLENKCWEKIVLTKLTVFFPHNNKICLGSDPRVTSPINVTEFDINDVDFVYFQFDSTLTLLRMNLRMPLHFLLRPGYF